MSSATFPLVRRPAPLWLLVLVTFSGTLAMHMFVPALPVAARALDASAATIRMTISVYIVGLAVGQLVYGPLSGPARSAGARSSSRSPRSAC